MPREAAHLNRIPDAHQAAHWPQKSENWERGQIFEIELWSLWMVGQ